MTGDSAHTLAEADATCARALAELPASQWRVFHDVRWPGHPLADIDHVVVGPSGVFVIDTCNWAGNIEVRVGVLRQNGHRREKAVAAVALAAHTVSQAVPGLDPGAVKPVLCFVREKPVFGWSHEVMVCSLSNIGVFLASRPRVLDDVEVQQLAEQLALSFQAAPAATPVTVSRREAEAAAELAAARTAAPSSTPTATPTPSPVARPPARRSPLAAGSAARSFLFVGALALLAFLALQLGMPGRMSDVGSRTMRLITTPPRSAGDTVILRGDHTRPRLELTALTPVSTGSLRPGVRVESGHRLLAVPFVVHNGGDREWLWEPADSVELVDSDSAVHRPSTHLTAVRGGPVLPALVRVAPGRSVRGLVVFELSGRAQPDRVEVTKAAGVPRTVRWSLS